MSNLGRVPPTEQEVRDLLPGYVLGILEPDELLAVDDYLVAHPKLHQEVRSLEDASSQLAYAAPTVTPPTGVKEQVLSRAQAAAAVTKNTTENTPVLPNSRHRPDRRVSTSPTASPLGVRQRTQPNHVPQRSRAEQQAKPTWQENTGNWWRNAFGWKIYALTATAAIALLAFIFNQSFTVSQQRIAELTESNEATISEMNDKSAQLTLQVDALRSDNDTLLAKTETLQSEYDQLQQKNNETLQTVEQLDAEKNELQNLLREQNQFLTRVLLAEPLVTLAGTNDNSVASGSLRIDSDGAYLVLGGLEQLSADKTYQLWLIPEGADPVSSGLITVDKDGTATVDVDLTLDLDNFSTVGLSIEPAGGSASPTLEQIVLLGQRA